MHRECFWAILSSQIESEQRRNLEAGLRLALGVGALPLDRQLLLTVVSVVELTVGVICSCLTSFPGFFRYHLPLLRAISSFFSSSFRSLHLSRQLKPSSNPSNTPGSNPSSTKRLVTKNIKLTLGSRIDGGGRFLGPASVFATDADWLPLPEATRNSPTTNDKAPDATHRAYYEMAEQQQSQDRYLPPHHNHHTQESCTQRAFHAVPVISLTPKEQASSTTQSGASGSAWWKRHRQLNTHRTGYWDILTLFRKESAIYPSQSEMHSEINVSVV